MDRFYNFLEDFSAEATTLTFLILISSLVLSCATAVRGWSKKRRSDKDAINAKHARDRAVKERDKIQSRLDTIIDERSTSHPHYALEKLKEHLFESQFESAHELADTYTSTQSEMMVAIAAFKAEQKLLDFAEDGEAALAEAERFIAQGYVFQPNSNAMHSIQSEVNALRSNDDPETTKFIEFNRDADVSTLLTLADMLIIKGKYTPAKLVAETARTKARTENGITTNSFADATNMLGKCEAKLGDYVRAEKLYKQSISIIQKTMGKQGQVYAKFINNLAHTYELQKKLGEAEKLFLEAVEIDKGTDSEQNSDHALHLNNLAFVYTKMGRYDEAEPLYKKAIAIDNETAEQNLPAHATHLSNLADLYCETNRYDEAEPLYAKAIEIDKATIGEKHPDYASRLNNQSIYFGEIGKNNEAERLCKQAIEIYEDTLGPDHPDTINSKANLANLQSSR